MSERQSYADLLNDKQRQRFWRKVEKTESCWNWIAARNEWGYGLFGVRRKTARVHRIAYELLVGPIPTGMTLDHLCRNVRCVNPAHLEPVTNKENILRGESLQAQLARRTHCKRGHLLTPDNLEDSRGRGRGRCKRCNRERAGKKKPPSRSTRVSAVRA